MDEALEIVTAQDHLSGFKVVTVETKTGETLQLRLSAPSRERARGVQARMHAEGVGAVVAICRPELMIGEVAQATGTDVLDRLVPEAGDLVEFVALALTFGVRFQKKMVLMGTQMLADLQTGSMSGGPSLSAPAQDLRKT